MYNNARFEPNDINFIREVITEIHSQMECACLCHNNLMCLTATYFGTNQSCILFSARVQEEFLKIMMTNEIVSVLTFKNKTLPNPSRLTGINETVYGVCYTIAGSDSQLSSYFNGDDPTKAFDNDTNTKYSTNSSCNHSSEYSGKNSGLYFSLQRGSTLLVAFRFCTANNPPSSDPITITIEGSNRSNSALMNGSSWTLIYNGSSGLQINPGRQSFGTIQWLSNNSIWYISYRILVTSVRGSNSFVQYSELELLGY